MIKPFKTVDGIVYQVIVPIENAPVIIDICYSSDEDENGNEILEFEYAEISVENDFSKEKISEITDMLECGIEERIVRYLVTYYDINDINFDPSEYTYILNK